MGSKSPPSTAVVVSENEESRHLAGALLEEMDLRVMEIGGEDDATSLLDQIGDDLALVFVDSGGDGLGLRMQKETSQRCPKAGMVIAGGDANAGHAPRTAMLPRRWLPLQLLVSADQVLRSR